MSWVSLSRQEAVVRLTYRFLSTSALFLFMVTNVARAQVPEAKPPEAHEWDYGTEHGPQTWGDVKAEYATCSTGLRQSPIDIQKTQKAALPPIAFDYKPSSLRIIDNGHTIMVTYDAGSSIRVGDVSYQLKQFHFHRPSEEKIHGNAYEMVIHLVHQDAGGHLAVVAVLLELGKENALIRELWNHLPKEKEKESLLEGVKINAADLLPKNRGYYTFEGSLTTPPCSEGVTWFVLKQPAPISTDEVAEFSKVYPRNARPVQPLHDRIVRETK
jgi:carbonic anhydrase